MAIIRSNEQDLNMPEPCNHVMKTVWHEHDGQTFEWLVRCELCGFEHEYKIIWNENSPVHPSDQ